MKIKIIDLFNMISKGEKLPKKIMNRGVDWELDDEANHYYYLDDCGNNRFTRDDLFEELYEMHGLRFLNDEVEIEEEKKIPEKLTKFEAPFLKGDKPDIRFSLIIDQINEIIDYLQSKGE